MPPPEETKQTDFDSSVATLRRIDFLIKMLHDGALQTVGGKLESDSFYVNSLDRLFMEANAKLTEKEREQCRYHWEQIQRFKNEAGRDLYQREIRMSGYGRTPNGRHIQAWNRIIEEARRYELYLMECLDKHGMLLKNKAKVEDDLF